MPFDGVDVPNRRDEPPHGKPGGERVFRLMFLLIAIGSLMMPISLAALLDLVRYVWDR